MKTCRRQNVILVAAADVGSEMLIHTVVRMPNSGIQQGNVLDVLQSLQNESEGSDEELAFVASVVIELDDPRASDRPSHVDCIQNEGEQGAAVRAFPAP